MADKEIKQTIRLDGEKEYNAALQTARRNLRTLRSELKAETAELGANATAQQKNETRTKSLQKQIKEQEEIVKTLRQALQEAQRDYGDNEAVVAKWEQKLNDARATLGNMRNELDTLGQSFGDVHEQTEEGVVATKAFADSIASIASVGDSVSTAIEGIFTGMISRVSEVAEQLWDMISDTAARANNWTDIAGYWNTDPANVEKWARALEASGNSFSDFETIVSRLNLGGKGKDIAEMLGISDVNYEDQWAYAVAVMDRIAELQQKGEVPDNFWETVFGEKKATKAMDIVNDWETVQEGLKRYNADEGGFGMDSDALQTMNDLHVQIQGIQQDWQAIKDSVAAGFGTITGDLLFNVSGGLEALNDILNAETEQEREEAIKRLEQNLTELFGKVADAIRAGVETLSNVGEELSNSDDPVVSAIGKIMKDLADAFQWMIDNQDKVKTAFEAIFGTWLLAKLAAVAGKLTSIVAQIETIKAFTAVRGTEAITTAAETGASGIGTAASGAGIGIGAGVAALAGIGALFAKASQYRQRYGERGSVEAIENAAEGNDDLMDAFTEFIQSQAALEEAMMNVGTVSDEEADRLAEQADAASKKFYSYDEAGNMMHMYSDWRMENGLTNMDWALPDSAFFSRDDVADQVTGISSGVGTLEGKADTMIDGIGKLPGEISSSVTKAVGGITLTLDGATVGRILLPYISGGIARASVP